MRLFLVRHGETVHNVDKRIQGPLLDDSLSDRGRLQAARLSARFGKEHARGLRVDAVYASPMKRAWETALALAQGAQVPAVAVRRLDAMIEFSWGVYLGKTEEGEVLRAMEGMHLRWKAGEVDAAPPEGESPARAWARASQGLADVLAAHPQDATVAIVAHGRINKIVLAKLMHDDLSRMQEFGQGNTAVTLLEHPDPPVAAPGRWRLVYENDKSHLDGLPEPVAEAGRRPLV